MVDLPDITLRSVIGVPLSSDQVDGNFTNIRDFLEAILEDGGFTGRGIDSFDVTGDQLTIILTDAAELGPFTLPKSLLNPRGDWVTATAYAVQDCVVSTDVATVGNGYACIEAHTSGTFATDLAAHKWVKIVSRGATGAQGPTGQIGLQGPTGSIGPQGPTGAIGTQGPTGTIGLQGPTGSIGLQGPTGDTYAMRIATVVPSGAIAAFNWANLDTIRITLTDASTTLVFSGGVDGRSYLVEATQGSGGNKLVTGPSNLGVGSDITALPTLSTTAGKMDRLGFMYRSSSSSYDIVAFTRGYS